MHECGDDVERLERKRPSLFFIFEIDLAAGYITATVARRSGDLQIEKYHAALGTTANMQCGPHKPTSLTPLM